MLFKRKRLAKDTSLLIPRFNKLIPIKLLDSIHEKTLYHYTPDQSALLALKLILQLHLFVCFQKNDNRGDVALKWLQGCFL
jgi:hypothetical protein